MMGFSIQSVKGPDRTQRHREDKFVFLSGSIHGSNLGASCSWVSSLGLSLALIPLTFRLGLNCTILFPVPSHLVITRTSCQD